jgi:hypothetical protein
MNVPIRSSTTAQIMLNVLIYTERILAAVKKDSLTFRITLNSLVEFVHVSNLDLLIFIRIYAFNVKSLDVYFLAELIGCDVCNYHGTCYLSNQDQTICECFQWYAGKHCQFNLKGK